MKRTNRSQLKRRVAIIPMLVLIISGCGGSAPSSVDSAEDGQMVDITNTELVNQSGDCQRYLGNFISNVNDIQRSMMITGKVSITSDGSKCILESNSIPNHDFNDPSARFVTDTKELNKKYEFTASPQPQLSPNSLSLRLSEVVLLNGVKIDLLAAACYGVGQGEQLGNEKIGCFDDQIDNPWRYDPMSSLNDFGTDIHNAHVQPTGEYHYHATRWLCLCRRVKANRPLLLLLRRRRVSGVWQLLP
ncbi:YHYH protein [Veronia nyctiphanis]|uniref:YHYH protein n=1 Tax=Veronia nyctiphanis TaxID=1278244 RepID=UPI0022A8B9E3|nr:YHYH protein [Veronia nyctiphanis]